jgi:HSP20 family protein
MAIVRWAPFDLAGDSFDDVVRRTFGDFGTSLLAGRANQWAPALDAFVAGDELHVRLELPGVDIENDVDIEVENGVLHISGERKQERTEGNGEAGGWVRREMTYGRFERRIGLPEGIDADGVKATYDKGILDISIPVPAKPKTKVKVAVGETGTKQLEQ